MRAFSLVLAAAALLLASGCAPREAYYRPAEGKAIGRDGLVGVRSRVPPDAADNEATAVAALSPLVRSERDGRRAEIGAVIEFRNKRQEAMVFLPDSVSLASSSGQSFRPVAVTRGGRRVEGPTEIGHWREAAFVARLDLDAESAFEARTWLLSWSCRFGSKELPQSAAFSVTGPELARRSLSGDAAGLTTGASSRSESGVPLLMDLPFLGFLFRSSSARTSRSTLEVGVSPAAAGGISGQWWPLE